MQRSREFIALPIVVAIVAIVWFVLQVRAEGDEAAVRVAREDAARQVVERLAAAQKRFHGVEGRYGWLEELVAAGGLEDLDVRAVGAERYVVVRSYRVDVLLPATTSATQAVALAPRVEERVNERLGRRHFAVVARPWAGSTHAWRMWYLDERDAWYVNEGVSDPATRSQPPLPTVRVPEGGGTDPAGLRWWPLANLPER